MKILPLGMLKNTLGALAIVGTIATAANVAAQPKVEKPKTEQYDTFTKRAETVPPQGTTLSAILNKAPNPKVRIQGQVKTAKFVVNLSENILYHYDNNGKPIIAYRIASGKKSTPTHTGVRLVTYVETTPYKGAPRGTKRRRNPKAYGPKIIVLETLNPKTGEKGITGEFIHGTNNPSSIGKYASHGCMRMDNEVIKELSQQVKRGDIVLIIRP